MNGTLNNVNCPNCGTTNAPGTNFCVNCGTNLQGAVNNQNIIETATVNQPVQNQQMNQNTNVNQGAVQVANPSANAQTMNIVGFLLGVLLKPFAKFKEEEENLSSFKNSAIIAGIITGGATIISLLITMFNTVRVKSFWSGEVNWVWDNLKNIEYVKVIGMNLLMYAGVIFGLAAMYYVASLIIKKETKYPKLLGATAAAMLPGVVSVVVLSPILSMIHYSLGLVITIVGSIYSLMILIELMNYCIPIEDKNMRIYIHTACLSLALLIAGFVIYKIIMASITSTITGGLGALGDIFG